jgi:hypothetical protein
MKHTLSVIAIFSLSLLPLSSIHAQSQFTNGLVAFYPFNGNANDESGGGHNGIVSRAVLTADRFGVPGRAYSFNGTNGYIRVGSMITGSQPFTWSVWFRPRFAATNLWATIICQGGDPGWNMMSPGLEINPTNHVMMYPGSMYFYTYTADIGEIVVSNPRSRWDTNSWYQAVVTSDADGNRGIYINGVCEGTATNQPFGQQLGNFYIGGCVSYDLRYFAGEIDDIRVYNRALPTSEVQQLYQYETAPVVSLAKAVRPAFASLSVGSNYQLQVSTDLNTWTNHGPFFAATNSSMIYPGYWDVDNWDGLFFRLQVVP